MTAMTLDVPDLDGTLALGRRLGERLFPGAVLALVGPLGAGKTHFTRGVCEGLGVADSRVVTSPTFVLIQEYDGRLPVYHFDAYRLDGPAPFAALGADEYLYGDGVCLVEWADRVEPVLPPGRLTVVIEPLDAGRRRFHFSASDERHAALLDGLAAA
jgi:tRNA threonylcarbamoyladenosine biosynthesis protein TsaE